MRKYLWLRAGMLAAVIVFYMIAADGISVLASGWISIALRAALIILTIKTGVKLQGYLYNKTLYHILFVEMDPAKYKEAIYSSKWHTPNVWERIAAATYGSDGTETVNLITTVLRGKTSLKYKRIYLSWLACTYFHADDAEKLKAVCDAFDKTLPASKKSEKIRQEYRMFSFYRQYIDGNYAACLEYLDAPPKSKAAEITQAIRRINNIYARALILYKSGNTDAAKPFFDRVRQEMPKMYLAVRAQKYLTAMETGETVEFQEILPDADFAVYTPAQKKKILWKKRILNTLLALAIAFVLLSVVRGFLSAPLYGWVFTEDECTAIFQLAAEELLAADPEEYGLPADFFEECAIEENGNLFLWLSKKQQTALRHSPLLTSSGNPRIEIAPDGREIVVHAYRETIHEDIHEAFQNIYKKALLMQELDCIPREGRKIVFIIRDGVTGEEYYRNLWPEDCKEFYPEDYPLHALPQ